MIFINLYMGLSRQATKGPVISQGTEKGSGRKVSRGERYRKVREENTWRLHLLGRYELA